MTALADVWCIYENWTWSLWRKPLTPCTHLIRFRQSGSDQDNCSTCKERVQQLTFFPSGTIRHHIYLSMEMVQKSSCNQKISRVWKWNISIGKTILQWTWFYKPVVLTIASFEIIMRSSRPGSQRRIGLFYTLTNSTLQRMRLSLLGSK